MRETYYTPYHQSVGVGKKFDDHCAGFIVEADYSVRSTDPWIDIPIILRSWLLLKNLFRHRYPRRHGMFLHGNTTHSGGRSK